MFLSLLIWSKFFLILDSPGIPPSATAHELFRGFSYVAPSLLYVVGEASSTSTLIQQPSASSDSSGGEKNDSFMNTNGGIASLPSVRLLVTLNSYQTLLLVLQ